MLLTANLIQKLQNTPWISVPNTVYDWLVLVSRRGVITNVHGEVQMEVADEVRTVACPDPLASPAAGDDLQLVPALASSVRPIAQVNSYLLF